VDEFEEPDAEPDAEPGLEFIEPGPDEPEDAMADLALPLDEVRLPPPPPIPGAGPEHCAYCGGTFPVLPAGRRVLFCPHCGQSRGTTRCPECRSEVELGWRHCVACGAAVN
jgi:hypothetical protein